VPAIPPEKRDPYGAWLYRHYDRSEYEVTEAHIRTARHAYYANISLVDDLIGGVLDALRNIRELDDTAIVFCADHGDMLGERGLWYKMAPYERSTRIPLIVSTPDDRGGRRVSANVSLIDVLPTVLDLAGEGGSLDPIEPLDGRSLAPFLTGGGEGWADVAASELFFEGLAEPALMLRKGRYKYIRCNRQTQLLFDIESDPHELRDLVARRWDFDRLTEEILLSQRRRNLIQRSILAGRYPAWDFQPFEDATRLYYRGDGGDWHAAEQRDFLRFK
jgi:choline-sulfatase